MTVEPIEVEHCGNVNYVHEPHDWIDPSNFLYRLCLGTRPLDGSVTVVKREPRTDAELLAMAFHETYERLAPEHGYETREASAKPWNDVPANNRALMCAVTAELIARFNIFVPAGVFDDEPGGAS